MTTTTAVLELGHRWVTAERAGEADTLAELADQDFRLVGPLGFVLDEHGWFVSRAVP